MNSDVVVVDASTALKWALVEDQTDHARRFLTNMMLKRRRIVSAPLLFDECLNAIYKQQRRGLLTAVEADEALSVVLSAPIELFAPPDLHRHALRLARHHDLPSTYDALYLTVARSLDAEIWTADNRLYNTLHQSVGWIHRIADYPMEDV